MTEQEWLESKYPTHIMDYIRDWATSDQLRCFSLACGIKPEVVASWKPLSWSWFATEASKYSTRSDEERADILRDIIGNPWNPLWPYDPNLTRWRCPCGNMKLKKMRVDLGDGLVLCHKCNRENLRVTKQLLDWNDRMIPKLAKKARYETGIKCDNGQELHSRLGCWEYESCGPDSKWALCSACGGRGYIDPYLINNDNLIILADALEEAGFNHELSLIHLRQTEVDYTETVDSNQNCPQCGRGGRWRSGVGFEHEKICMKCDLAWEPGERVAIKRTKQVKHYQGCSVVAAFLDECFQ